MSCSVLIGKNHYYHELKVRGIVLKNDILISPRNTSQVLSEKANSSKPAIWDKKPILVMFISLKHFFRIAIPAILPNPSAINLYAKKYPRILGTQHNGLRRRNSKLTALVPTVARIFMATKIIRSMTFFRPPGLRLVNTKKVLLRLLMLKKATFSSFFDMVS